MSRQQSIRQPRGWYAAIRSHPGERFTQICQDRDSEQMLARWQEVEPALRRVAALGDVPMVISGETRAGQDELLSALVRLTQTGDQAAAVALLWTLAPWCHKTARWLHRESDEFRHLTPADSTHVIEASLFEEMVRFPTHRLTYSIAANLTLNALRRVTPRRPGRLSCDPKLSPVEEDPFDSPPQDVDPAELDGCNSASRGEEDVPLWPGEVPSRRTEIISVLAWAVEGGYLRRRDVQLLSDVYLKAGMTSGEGVSKAARKYGLSPATVRKRCSRATQALKYAIQHAAADEEAPARAS